MYETGKNKQEFTSALTQLTDTDHIDMPLHSLELARMNYQNKTPGSAPQIRLWFQNTNVRLTIALQSELDIKDGGGQSDWTF